MTQRPRLPPRCPLQPLQVVRTCPQHGDIKVLEPTHGHRGLYSGVFLQGRQTPRGLCRASLERTQHHDCHVRVVKVVRSSLRFKKRGHGCHVSIRGVSKMCVHGSSWGEYLKPPWVAWSDCGGQSPPLPTPPTHVK